MKTNLIKQKQNIFFLKIKVIIITYFSLNVQLKKLFFSDIEMVEINDGDEDKETTNMGKDARSSTDTLTDVKVDDETKTSTGNEEVIYAKIHKKWEENSKKLDQNEKKTQKIGFWWMKLKMILWSTSIFNLF